MQSITQYQLLVAIYLGGLILFGILAIKHLLFDELAMGIIAIIFTLTCYWFILSKKIEWGVKMTDLYYIVELTDGKETWRSEGYTERRKAEMLARLKQKANPKKVYKLELQQPKKAYKY